jgi:predicted nucleic acid-binding protein
MNEAGHEVPDPVALADTSIFIGLENGRFDPARIPPKTSVSVVTIAELRLGVLTAESIEIRGKRLATLRLAESLDPIPVDDAVADAWALLVSRLRAAGKRVPENDSWIAATAMAKKMPVTTQDGDYEKMPGVRVIRV